MMNNNLQLDDNLKKDDNNNIDFFGHENGDNNSSIDQKSNLFDNEFADLENEFQ